MELTTLAKDVSSTFGLATNRHEKRINKLPWQYIITICPLGQVYCVAIIDNPHFELNNNS